MPGLLPITREPVVTPQHIGISPQPGIADSPASTKLPIQNPLSERGVVELGGDSEGNPTRTRALLEKGGRLGLFALTLSTLAGCAQPSRTPVTPPPATAPPANFVVFDGTLYQGKPSAAQLGMK